MPWWNRVITSAHNSTTKYKVRRRWKDYTYKDKLLESSSLSLPRHYFQYFNHSCHYSLNTLQLSISSWIMERKTAYKEYASSSHTSAKNRGSRTSLTLLKFLGMWRISLAFFAMVSPQTSHLPDHPQQTQRCMLYPPTSHTETPD